MSTINKSRESQSTIARFDPIQNNWSELGILNVARSAHGVIQVDNEFIVIGGLKDQIGVGFGVNESYLTESCKLYEKSIKCSTREPKLSGFAYYPELIRV